METIRQSGWKRIGIIASVAWILGAGAYTFSVTSDEDSKRGSEITLMCEGFYSSTGPKWSADCDKRGFDYTMQARSSELEETALVAFVPVPVGWGAAYLVILLVRWVRRGFHPIAH